MNCSPRKFTRNFGLDALCSLAITMVLINHGYIVFSSAMVCQHGAAGLLP